MAKSLVPVVLVVLLLSGCGGSGDDDASAPATSPAGTTAASPSPSASESAAESPSASSSTPAVTPASGRTVETFSMTFQVPRDFKGGGEVGNGLLSSVNVQSRKCGCQIFAGGLGNLNSEDLEGAAGVLADRGTRQPDIEVAGRQALLFVGEDKTLRTYTVASIAGDQIATFAMVFTTLEGLTDTTPESERALLDSILATVQWKA